MSVVTYDLRKPGPLRLSDQQKAKIRDLYNNHEVTTRDLSVRFSVSMRTIQTVLREEIAVSA